MPLWVVPLLAGLACAAVYLTALRAPAPEAQPLASCLAITWALYNAAWFYGVMWALPVIDWYVGLVAWWLWLRGQKRWVALFVRAIAVRLILHVLDAITWHAFEQAYIHALNATYAWMLVLVADSGGYRGSFSDRVRALRARLWGPAPAELAPHLARRS